MVCIDRYSGFKYRRSSESRGGAGIGYRSSGGGAGTEFGGRSNRRDMRLSQHNRMTNRKGSDRKGSRSQQKRNKGDKKISRNLNKIKNKGISEVSEDSELVRR